MHKLARWFALPLVMIPLASVAAIGCDGSDEGPVTEEQATKNIRIGAGDLEALAPGETLKVDLAADGTLYHFLFDRPLDYSRISLTLESGSQASMATAMEAVFASPYTPAEATDQRFILTGDPENFTELTDAEIDRLRVEGMLMTEKSGTTQAQPQSVDDCIEQVIYTYVVIVIDGVEQGFWCAHQLLICDGVTACSEVYSHGGHDYIFCNGQKSWDDARAYCQSFNLDLATVNDGTEEEWIYHQANLFSRQKWWIGLNDRSSEGNFGWASGASLGYTNWYAAEPNNGGGNEDCGQLNRFHPSKGWNDEPCPMHLRYVCESH